MAEASNFEIPSLNSGSLGQHTSGLFSDSSMWQRPSLLDTVRQENEAQSNQIPQVELENTNQTSDGRTPDNSDYSSPDYNGADQSNYNYQDNPVPNNPDQNFPRPGYPYPGYPAPGYPYPNPGYPAPQPGYPNPSYPVPSPGYGNGYGYGYGYGSNYPGRACPYPGGGYPPQDNWGIPHSTERVYRRPPGAPLPQQPPGELYDKRLPHDSRYHCIDQGRVYELKVLDALERMQERNIYSSYIPLDPRQPRRDPRQPITPRDLPALFVKQIIGHATGDRRTGPQAHLTELEPLFIERQYANIYNNLTGKDFFDHPQTMAGLRTGDVFITFTPTGVPTNAFFYIAPDSRRAITPNGGHLSPEAAWVDKNGVIHISPFNLDRSAPVHVYRPSARQRY